MNLLLAEDDEITRLFLTEVLTHAGHSVDSVADGDSAVNAARHQHYDLLLLDLNLPGCAGDVALASIRADVLNVNRDTPAIGSTADASEATRSRLLAAGFSSVLIKPMAAVDVLAATQSLIPASMSGGCTSSDAAGLWDDAQALLTAGGNQSIVDALRGLLLRDLPEQSQRILRSARSGQAEPAAAELHKLRAACSFCGASALGRAAERLEQMLAATAIEPDAEISDFERASAELLTVGAAAIRS